MPLWRPAILAPLISVINCLEVGPNMTCRQRGPKRKLWVGYRAPSVQRTSYLYVPLLCCERYIFFIVECGIAHSLCATRVFDARASSSLPGYCAKCRLFRGLRCWANPWRIIAYWINLWISHSPSLFDAPGTEAFASEYFYTYIYY